MVGKGRTESGGVDGMARVRIARRVGLALTALALGACAGGVHEKGLDPQTAGWWRTTEVLSSDAMEGRDTGSAGYDRAAAYVAERFAQAGLKPAGDNGTYL